MLQGMGHTGVDLAGHETRMHMQVLNLASSATRMLACNLELAALDVVIMLALDRLQKQKLV